jgi:ribosomal protein S12 methylthiotransferase
VSRGTCPDRYGGNTYICRTYADAPEVDGEVFIKSAKPLKIGGFAQVKITDTLEYDLVGEIIL